ncbi:MAG: zinc-ribbon domain-containing protein, partial [Pseudomonadota bacterium]
MRLVCPNCDATYEVPESVIPPEGRDVQCSNCGKSWFFNPNAPEPEPEPEPDPVPETGFEAEPETVYTPEPEASYEAPAVPEPAPAPAPAPAATKGEPQRRPLDEVVANVLREEAAYEARARAEDAGLEYQEDLPLDVNTPAPQPEPARVSAPSGSRRDLLPDIDDINATLRATSERHAGEEAPDAEVTKVQRRGQGFRTGFGISLLVLGIFAGLYSYSAVIAEAVPGL